MPRRPPPEKTDVEKTGTPKPPIIPPAPKVTARAMRPLWRDLILSVWALGEQVAEELVLPAEATRLSTQKPFHPSDQIGLRRLDQPTKMIPHQNIGANLPVRLGVTLAESLDEPLTIRHHP